MILNDPSSQLLTARLDRGWRLEEVTEKIRTICHGDNGRGCRMNVEKLRQFESRLYFPGAQHAAALSTIYQMTPEDLGLIVPAEGQTPESLQAGSP